MRAMHHHVWGNAYECHMFLQTALSTDIAPDCTIVFPMTNFAQCVWAATAFLYQNAVYAVQYRWLIDWFGITKIYPFVFNSQTVIEQYLCMISVGTTWSFFITCFANHLPLTLVRLNMYSYWRKIHKHWTGFVSFELSNQALRAVVKNVCFSNEDTLGNKKIFFVK